MRLETKERTRKRNEKEKIGKEDKEGEKGRNLTNIKKANMEKTNEQRIEQSQNERKEGEQKKKKKKENLNFFCDFLILLDCIS